MGKISSSKTKSKISAAASPAASSNASSQKSSILKCSFAPSRLQLRLFASVIQNFDSQQLRIHDTTNSRLRCQHSAGSGSRITCLDWGYYKPTGSDVQPSKKRKRNQNSSQDAVLAYGTTDSEICMFSPTESKVVGRLMGAHESGINDFRFAADDNNEAWSLGTAGDLIQWDLANSRPIRTITLPDPSMQTLTPRFSDSPHILCASATPFAINLHEDDFSIEKFDSFKNPVHTLYRPERLGDTAANHFLAADKDRYINLYDIKQKRLVRTLIAGADIVSIDLSEAIGGNGSTTKQSLLAVVTKDGLLEAFVDPFAQPPAVNGELTSSRKNLTKKASAKIRLISTGTGSVSYPIFTASVQGPDLVIASVDGGVELSFQKVRWQDEGTGDLLFTGVKEISRLKSPSSLSAVGVNGVKDVSQSHVNESRTVVVNGTAEPDSHEAVIDISSDEEAEEADDSEEEDEPEKESINNTETALVPVNDSNESDEEMVDAPTSDQPMDEDQDNQVGAEQETEEPSFGEMLALRQTGEAITILDAFQTDSAALAVPFGSTNLSLTAGGMSLGTVLTQALRTNDRNLLESCLHTTDAAIVRNTIQRLDSGLAGTLLSKLAERLSSRPGRYGHLMTWVQWTCVAHGGAIALQPLVVSKLRTLYRVLGQRAKSMDNLLLLKGKLDMLDAQLTFRKQLQAQRNETMQKSSGNNTNEPGIIYIEGAEDNWDSDEDQDSDAAGAGALGLTRPSKKAKSRSKPRKKIRTDLDDLIADQLSDGMDDDEDMPMTNGVDGSSSDEEEEDDDDENNELINLSKLKRKNKSTGIIDDEAEVSGLSSGSEEEASEDDDDDEDGEGDDDDDEEEEEEDSELDSFINDGSISEASDDGLLDDKAADEDSGDDKVKSADVEVVVDGKKRKPRSKKSKF